MVSKVNQPRVSWPEDLEEARQETINANLGSVLEGMGAQLRGDSGGFDDRIEQILLSALGLEMIIQSKLPASLKLCIYGSTGKTPTGPKILGTNTQV